VRVYTYPADRYGCGFYRLMAPAVALRAQGHDVTIVMPDERTGDAAGLRGYQDEAGTIIDVSVPPDADVMVFQRITMLQLAAAIPIIRAKGVAVVVDMDDDLTAIDPRNVAFTSMHPRHGKPGHSWQAAALACRDATLVTVSTKGLLRTYAQHGRGVVVDNYVPAGYLDVEHHDSDLLGWPGTIHSHPGDLPALGASLARLLREGARFLNVGDGEGLRDALGLEQDPPATGFVPLERWPDEIARIGVGVAPLADTKFNRGKSRLKVLEMSACGVPWVASPRAEYTRMQQEAGVGLLADKPSDWYRKLSRLLVNPRQRADMSAAGREYAAGQTIEGNAWRWWEAWSLAYQRRQAASRPRVAPVSPLSEPSGRPIAAVASTTFTPRSSALPAAGSPVRR
jgi:glycosyltransferase involved in cell wall biosynthesis